MIEQLILKHPIFIIALTLFSFILFIWYERKSKQVSSNSTQRLSSDPKLKEIISRLEIIRNVHTNNTEIELNNYCQQIQLLAYDFQDVIEVYKNADLQIERFTSKYLTFIAPYLNTKYVLGESHSNPPNKEIFVNQFSNLIKDLKSKDLLDFYNSLLDTGFLVFFGTSPNASSTTDEKSVFMNEIINRFNTLLRSDLFSTNINHNEFLDFWLKKIILFQDSHLLSLYHLFKYKILFEEMGKINKSKLSFYFHSWFEAWINSDYLREYNLLASIWTLIQESYDDEPYSEYIIRESF